jgi:hypothetical protein
MMRRTLCNRCLQRRPGGHVVCTFPVDVEATFQHVTQGDFVPRKPRHREELGGHFPPRLPNEGLRGARVVNGCGAIADLFPPNNTTSGLFVGPWILGENGQRTIDNGIGDEAKAVAIHGAREARGRFGGHLSHRSRFIPWIARRTLSTRPEFTSTRATFHGDLQKRTVYPLFNGPCGGRTL